MTAISEGFIRRANNMYPLSLKQWNPYVGCKHKCKYCEPSFQRALKRFSKCDGCLNFTPHTHIERLDQRLPRTRYMQFIFTCSSGDVAFCADDYFFDILNKIDDHKDKNFLIQSKDPRKAFLDRCTTVPYPKNLILGTTIETNLARLTKEISKAPPPIERFKAMLELREAFPKQSLMVTIESVLYFKHKIMVDWIEKIDPCMIWIGYDSKRCNLKEPALAETWMLAQDLIKRGYVVILKLMRKAWWERQ